MEEETEAHGRTVICLRSQSKDVQSWEEKSDLLSWSVGGTFKMFDHRYSRAPTNQNRVISQSIKKGPGGPCWASGTPSVAGS